MLYLLFKAVATGLIVVTVSEIAKRSSLFAAAIASLPLTSILAFIWIYTDSKNIETIEKLSYEIFWLVIPSLSFFIILPALLKSGINFYPSLLLSCVALSVVYAIYAKCPQFF